MPFLTVTCMLALLCAAAVFRADARRRGVSRVVLRKLSMLALLDLICPALLVGIAVVALLMSARSAVLPLFSPLTWSGAAVAVIAVFLWTEGLHQAQFQRPTGILLGEALVLAGIFLLVQRAVFGSWEMGPHGTTVATAIFAIVAGGLLMAVIVPPFVKRLERHRIIERVDGRGEFQQSEYTPATHECPHPERWKMVDPQSAELEVLEFLKSLVITLKPDLVVETGTFLGHSAIKMAEGLKENGFGKLITVEYDPVICARAQERIDASSVREWIECRNQSSLEVQVDSMIDLFFSDSYLQGREEEIRRFLPRINPQGLILVHDASSHFRVVRETMLKLESEGLVSTVLMSTPRGIVVAQRREGRK